MIKISSVQQEDTSSRRANFEIKYIDSKFNNKLNLVRNMKQKIRKLKLLHAILIKLVNGYDCQESKFKSTLTKFKFSTKLWLKSKAKTELHPVWLMCDVSKYCCSYFVIISFFYDNYPKSLYWRGWPDSLSIYYWLSYIKLSFSF